jgi:hypothetical protein
VSADGILKIGDFGLACLESLDETDSAVETATTPVCQVRVVSQRVYVVHRQLLFPENRAAFLLPEQVTLEHSHIKAQSRVTDRRSMIQKWISSVWGYWWSKCSVGLKQ